VAGLASVDENIRRRLSLIAVTAPAAAQLAADVPAQALQYAAAAGRSLEASG